MMMQQELQSNRAVHVHCNRKTVIFNKKVCMHKLKSIYSNLFIESLNTPF